MSAKTAFELGAPIRGVLAFTSTSNDKAGRSIPAPGRGAVTVAREIRSKHPLPVLDTAYRSRQMAFHHNQMFPSKAIHTDGVRAGVMSSFGFGQVGGTALIVHPRYLPGALEPTYYEAYKQHNRVRALSSYKVMSDMMIKKSLVKIKEHPPYVEEHGANV